MPLDMDQQDSPEDDAPDLSETDKRIDKLWDRIGKMFPHLYEDNMERYPALDKILNALNEINTLENRTGEDKISLQTIYNMAQSGGSGDITELREANAALAEEREALLESARRLLFRVKQLKNIAADEILKKDQAGLAHIDVITLRMGEIAECIAEIDVSIKAFGSDKPPASLSERMLGAVMSPQNPVLTMLETTPARRTEFSDFLRQRGFAYDHLDLRAIQSLIIGQQKILERYDTIVSNMETLNNVLDIVNSIRGWEERNTTEYQEALDQIDRLQKHCDDLDERCATIEELDAEIAAKTAEKTQLQTDIGFLQKMKKDINIGNMLGAAAAGLANVTGANKEDAGTDSALKKEIEELERKLAASKNAGRIAELEKQAKIDSDIIDTIRRSLTQAQQEIIALQDRVPLLLTERKRLLNEMIPMAAPEDTLEEILEVTRIAGSVEDKKLLPALREIIRKLHKLPDEIKQKDRQIAELEIQLEKARQQTHESETVAPAGDSLLEELLRTTEETLAQRTKQLETARRKITELQEAAQAQTTPPPEDAKEKDKKKPGFLKKIFSMAVAGLVSSGLQYPISPAVPSLQNQSVSVLVNT